MRTARFRGGLPDERGATMLEYSLMAGLISLVCIFAVGYAGEQTKLTFKRVGDEIYKATDSNPDPPLPPPPPPN